MTPPRPAGPRARGRRRGRLGRAARRALADRARSSSFWPRVACARRSLMLGPAFVASIAYVDPGQLRHEHRRRRAVRLPAAVGRPAGERDGDADPVPLGQAGDRHRPQLSRSRPRAFPRPFTWGMWVQAEIMAMSTDIAEFLGAALGLNLLFGVPLLPAGLITGVIAFAILELQTHGFRRFELAITALLGIIFAGFLYETLRIGPSVTRLAARPLARPARRRLAVPRRRDHRRDRDAARHLPALGADQGPHALPQRPRARPRAALRAPRRDHRARPRRPRQHGDARRRRQALPHPGPLGSEHDPASPRPVRPPRRRHRRARVRGRAARLRRLLVQRRHLRRAGRHGRLHQRPHPAAAAPRGHHDPRIVVLAIGINPTSVLVLSQVVLSFGIPLASCRSSCSPAAETSWASTSTAASPPSSPGAAPA